MAKWSEASKERAAARREYRIDEVASALITSLKKLGLVCEGKTMVKKQLHPIVEKRCEYNRNRQGYQFVPTVENTLVRIPNVRFIQTNWKDITLYCAENLKEYVVWESSGVRLGSFEEFQLLQDVFKGGTAGMMESHNARSDIINDQGGEATYIGLMLEAGKKEEE